MQEQGDKIILTKDEYRALKERVVNAMDVERQEHILEVIHDQGRQSYAREQMKFNQQILRDIFDDFLEKVLKK